MSTRFIGYQSYVPQTPGNFVRGQTRTIRVLSQDSGEDKTAKALKYRQELDRQVQEQRLRKEEIKRKEKEEDLKREREFYESLKFSKVSQGKNKNSRLSPPNFHYNERQNPE